jgi:integrase
MPKKEDKPKARKRANGEGTYYRNAEGKWVHQVTFGRKPDGRLDRKTFTGDTRGECKKKREKYVEDRDRLLLIERAEEEQAAKRLAEAAQSGRSAESEALFEEAFMRWLKLFKSPPTKKATTYSGYLDVYEDHFIEHFGGKMLYEITQDVVQEYYNEKQKNGGRKDGRTGGLSAKTIRNHHMLLKDFFAYAVKKYKLAGNPTLETSRPEVIFPKRRVLTQEEMLIFLEEVVKETQRAAMLVMLFTGLRVGELLALEVDDIDVNAQTVEIRRNIARVRTESANPDNPRIRILNHNPQKKTHLVVQETPKSKNSNREMPLSDGIFMLVAKHLYFLEQSNWPNPHNLLFPSTKGTYIDPKSYEIRLDAVSKRCEIRKVNPHALRHTFATRLIEEKVPITTVQELLGHASVSTTQRYITTMVEEKKDAVESLSVYLDPARLINGKQLNGSKKRMRFEDVRLPSWLQNEPTPAGI